MADVYVTLQVMPTSPDVSMDTLRDAVSEKITAFGGRVTEHAVKPFAFGLQSLEIVFVMPEEKGDLEPLEKDIAGLGDVESVQVVRVSRAFG